MNLAYFWVALGGAIGSVGRYWLNEVVAGKFTFAQTFPLGILIINVSGSFLIGVFAAFSDPEGRLSTSPGFRQFFMIGICGGYTTFSSFSLNTLKLVQARQWLYAGSNVILSVALCLIAVWLGYVVGSLVNSLKGS
jgi:CrcB protein